MVVAESAGIDEEHIPLPCELRHTLHDPVHHHPDEGEGAEERQSATLERGCRGTAVVVDQRHGGQTEQVQQVHPDAEAHQIGDQHQPAVRALVLAALLPLEDQPEDHRGEERAEGIHLRFDSAEPEGVRERVHQATHQTRAEDSDSLPHRHHLTSRLKALLAEMRTRRQHTAHHVSDGPEEEEDREATQHGTRSIGHQCRTLRATAQMRDHIIDQHVEGRARRVPDLELVVTSDELRTVPQAR